MFEKLKIRLKTDLGVDAESFIRLRPGHWQRSDGAWLWMCVTKTGLEFGGWDTATKCINPKNKLYMSDGRTICAEQGVQVDGKAAT